MRDPAPASVNKNGFWHQPPSSIQPPVYTCAHIHTHVCPLIKTCIHIYYICMQVEKENSQLLKMIIHNPLTFFRLVAFPQNRSSLSTPRCRGYPKLKALSPVLSFWIQSFSGISLQYPASSGDFLLVTSLLPSWEFRWLYLYLTILSPLVLFIILCIWEFCLNACMSHASAHHAQQEQRRALHLLDLALWMAFNHSVGAVNQTWGFWESSQCS